MKAGGGGSEKKRVKGRVKMKTEEKVAERDDREVKEEKNARRYVRRK